MKNNLLIIFSIISTLSVIGWMITDFYGGMIIYLIMYSWFIIPLIIIYAITFLTTCIRILINGIKSNKIVFYVHMIGLISILSFSIYNSELLKSRILLDATLIDDLSSINIILRENGTYESIASGMLGYSDKDTGKYLKKNDTIIFLNRSESDNFIPENAIIDLKDSAVYYERNSIGQFKKVKTFANYYKINKYNF